MFVYKIKQIHLPLLHDLNLMVSFPLQYRGPASYVTMSHVLRKCQQALGVFKTQRGFNSSLANHQLFQLPTCCSNFCETVFNKTEKSCKAELLKIIFIRTKLGQILISPHTCAHIAHTRVLPKLIDGHRKSTNTYTHPGYR